MMNYSEKQGRIVNSSGKLVNSVSDPDPFHFGLPDPFYFGLPDPFHVGYGYGYPKIKIIHTKINQTRKKIIF